MLSDAPLRSEVRASFAGPRVLGALTVLGLGGLAPAWASGTFTVGSFTKSTSAAPVTQAVAHGVGSTPKALILWTNGKTGTTLGAGFLYAFGMTDGTTSASTATASDDDGVTPRAPTADREQVLTIDRRCRDPARRGRPPVLGRDQFHPELDDQQCHGVRDPLHRHRRLAHLAPRWSPGRWPRPPATSR